MIDQPWAWPVGVIPSLCPSLIPAMAGIPVTVCSFSARFESPTIGAPVLHPHKGCVLGKKDEKCHDSTLPIGLGSCGWNTVLSVNGTSLGRACVLSCRL